jgi:predicted nucleotidyltransferase
MKLLSNERAVTLVHLFRELDAHGRRCVLVGGQVPPLLQKMMDPEEEYLATASRSTADCDVAMEIAICTSSEWDQSQALLVSLKFEKNERVNQFRWKHTSGLLIDLLPVPAGIERGDPAAVEFSRDLVPEGTSTFFRGFELALARFEVVEIEVDDGSCYSLRIAGLPAMLAMKLQAWSEKPYDRKRDAQDIGWLLRYVNPELAAQQLLAARDQWSELIEEVVQRLEKNFSDPEHRGIADYASQAHGIDDSITARHRNAVVGAVTALLARYRQGESTT